jgi:hypothetical protein
VSSRKLASASVRGCLGQAIRLHCIPLDAVRKSTTIKRAGRYGEGAIAMNDIQDLHRQAMLRADEADRLRKQGNEESARHALHEAFALERQAAEQTVADMALEPTRSVLHRSAASLALECGNFREAERLIAVALSGEPPDEIAEELRDLLEQVYFDRPASGRRRPLARSVDRPPE